MSRIKSIILLVCLLVGSVSMAREVTTFNSDWKFKRGLFPEKMSLESEAFKNLTWENIRIPHTWNASDMQTAKGEYYQGDAFYQKKYTPDISLKDKRIFLKFEGVGAVAQVFVNRKFAGNHKGAYSAFTIELTRLLNFGQENEILIKVSNQSRPDVIPVNHNLFGVYGGIYRPVSLIITEKTNITLADNGATGVYVTQESVSKESAELSFKVKVENKNKKMQEIVLENSVFDYEGNLVKQTKSEESLPPQGTQMLQQRMTIGTPHLWQGLEDPYLYKVVTRIMVDGRKVDEIVQPLGLRKIEVKASDGVYLNGKKVPMYGVCRHQDWLGLGSALEEKNHDVDLQIIKEIGATTIRLAHYQQSEYFYSKCDSIGFLIWAEIPFVNRVTTEERENAKQQLTELVRQNYNHPSIYVWGLHNEVYNPYDYTIQLTRELHDLAKSEDPHRYTVSVNGFGELHNPANANADIQGINRYFGWYERTIQDFEPWVAAMEKSDPDYKVILAEYGAEANIFQQREKVGDCGDCCGATKDYNESFQTRFHEFQWGYIAKHPYLLASYLWNTFDFATPESFQGGIPARNMKGLVTFDRKVKKDAFYWYKANWSKEPVVYVTQRRVVNRTNEITPITVYSNRGVPTLFVNNKKVQAYKIGTTSVHYIFENIKLKKGTNKIKAVIKDGDKLLEDIVIWNYRPGQKQEELIIQKKEKEHGGL